MIPDSLYELAFAYKKTRLWTRLWDTDVFAVECDGGKLLYICVMGRLGNHCGVSVYTSEGFNSYYRLLELARQGVFDEESDAVFYGVTTQDCAQVSFENREMLSREEIDEVKAYTGKHGIRLTGKRAWPQFERFKPYRAPWYIVDKADLEHLAIALEACIELSDTMKSRKANAMDLGFEDIRFSESRSVPVMRRKNGVYELDGKTELPKPVEEIYPVGNTPDPAVVKKLKSKFKKGSIECAVLWIPKPAQEKEDEAAFFPVMLLAVLGKTGMVIPTGIVRDYEEDHTELLDAFLASLNDLNSLPKVWKVPDERTCLLLAAAAESLGTKIEICDIKDLRQLSEARDALLDEFSFDFMDDSMESSMEELKDMVSAMEEMVYEADLDIPGELRASLRESLEFEEVSVELKDRIRRLLSADAGHDTKILEMKERREKKVAPAEKKGSNILSEEDSKLFYQLWFPLLDYVNKHFRVNKKIGKMTGAKTLDPEQVKVVANYLWDHAGIINDYLKTAGKDLPEEHKEIVAGWKRYVKDTFTLERHLKNGSVLVSMETERVFRAVGIVSSWEEMFLMRDLPVWIRGTLIPFRDVIISDGLVEEIPVIIGSNWRKHFKELYIEAKRRGNIITSL